MSKSEAISVAVRLRPKVALEQDITDPAKGKEVSGWALLTSWARCGRTSRRCPLDSPSLHTRPRLGHLVVLKSYYLVSYHLSLVRLGPRIRRTAGNYWARRASPFGLEPPGLPACWVHFYAIIILNIQIHFDGRCCVHRLRLSSVIIDNAVGVSHRISPSPSHYSRCAFFRLIIA